VFTTQESRKREWGGYTERDREERRKRKKRYEREMLQRSAEECP
jgi:hypothetical protein